MMLGNSKLLLSLPIFTYTKVWLLINGFKINYFTPPEFIFRGSEVLTTRQVLPRSQPWWL